MIKYEKFDLCYPNMVTSVKQNKCRDKVVRTGSCGCRYCFLSTAGPRASLRCVRSLLCPLESACWASLFQPLGTSKTVCTDVFDRADLHTALLMDIH